MMWTEIWLYDEIGKEPRRIAKFEIGLEHYIACVITQKLAAQLFKGSWEWVNDNTLFTQHLVEAKDTKRVLEVR